MFAEIFEEIVGVVQTPSESDVPVGPNDVEACILDAVFVVREIRSIQQGRPRPRGGESFREDQQGFHGFAELGIDPGGDFFELRQDIVRGVDPREEKRRPLSTTRCIEEVGRGQAWRMHHNGVE